MPRNEISEIDPGVIAPENGGISEDAQNMDSEELGDPDVTADGRESSDDTETPNEADGIEGNEDNESAKKNLDQSESNDKISHSQELPDNNEEVGDAVENNAFTDNESSEGTGALGAEAVKENAGNELEGKDELPATDEVDEPAEEKEEAIEKPVPENDPYDPDSSLLGDKENLEDNKPKESGGGDKPKDKAENLDGDTLPDDESSADENEAEPVNGKADDSDEGTAEQIKCRNKELENQNHPETGVPFERKQVEVDGQPYEVVVPEFESFFDAQLPEDMYKESDRKQFKECNSQLKEAIGSNEELSSLFDDEQLEQIENGDTPDGYTWHHDAEPGKMQLVDFETHQKTGHTGGRNIWGGGTENR